MTTNSDSYDFFQIHECYLFSATARSLKRSEDKRPILTFEMESEVEEKFNGPDESIILQHKEAPDVTRKDFKTLQPDGKLNTGIINCYFEMITNRSKNSPGLPKTFAMSTFFYG